MSTSPAHMKALELIKNAQYEELKTVFEAVSGNEKDIMFKNAARTLNHNVLCDIQIKYILNKMQIYAKDKLMPMYNEAYNRFKAEENRDIDTANFIADVINIHKNVKISHAATICKDFAQQGLCLYMRLSMA